MKELSIDKQKEINGGIALVVTLIVSTLLPLFIRKVSISKYWK